MNTPVVTVVIPTHNSECFLRETLDSVMAQTFKNYEVVVVDDASTDDTVRLVEQYGDRIRLVRRSVNSRTADVPRYEGVEQGRGKYCALLDSDDVWLPEKLNKQVAFMEAHPEIPLSHTSVTMIDEQSKPLYVRHSGVIPATGSCARELLRHCFISTSSVMVRREAWLRAQRKEDLKTYGTEWDFFLSIARAHPVGFIPEPLAQYRVGSESVSRQKWKRAPRDVGAKQRVLRKKLWEGVILRSEMVAIITEACLENCRYWRDRGYCGRSVFFAAQALRHAPLHSQAWVELTKSALKPVHRAAKKK